MHHYFVDEPSCDRKVASRGPSSTSSKSLSILNGLKGWNPVEWAGEKPSSSWEPPSRTRTGPSPEAARGRLESSARCLSQSPLDVARPRGPGCCSAGLRTEEFSIPSLRWPGTLASGSRRLGTMGEWTGSMARTKCLGMAEGLLDDGRNMSRAFLDLLNCV